MCYNLSMKSVQNEETRTTETVTISRAEYEELKAQNAELSQQVQYLLEQMRLARKKQFGASSEQSRYDAPEQLSLFNEAEFFADARSAEPELVEIETPYRKKRSETKDSLPEDLPVETTEHFLRRKTEPALSVGLRCTSLARPCSAGLSLYLHRQ